MRQIINNFCLDVSVTEWSLDTQSREERIVFRTTPSTDRHTHTHKKVLVSISFNKVSAGETCKLRSRSQFITTM